MKRKGSTNGLSLNAVIAAITKLEAKQPGFAKGYLSTMTKNETPEDFVKRMKKRLKELVK